MPSTGTGDPTLTLPSSEQVTAGSTTPITGINYNDSFAAGNPGELYLGITDSSGTLSATDSEGAAPGSGSNSITVLVSYGDLTDILNSLSYTAGSAPGSDTISFDIWDQAGTETTGSIPVTIASNSNTETWTGATSGDWNTASNWSGGFVPTSGDTAIVPSGSVANVPTLSNAILNGETITIDGSATFNGVTLGAGSLLNGGLAALTVGGTLTVDSGASIVPTGALSFDPASSSTPVTIVNDGLIVTSGTTVFVSVYDTGNLINNGTIVSDGGVVLVGDTLFNDGSVSIAGGDVSVGGTIASGAIAFDGAGTLSLQSRMAFAGDSSIAGFGQGDRIVLSQLPGNSMQFGDGTLDILAAGTVVEAIPVNGSLGLGNFELHIFPAQGPSTSSVYFAPDGGPDGIPYEGMSDIIAPASASVQQDGTLGLGDVSITNAATMSLDITAGTGTLFMNGATGSGTDHLSVGEASQSQINADLASLTYVAGAGAGSDQIEISASESFMGVGAATSTRYIPVTVGGGIAFGPGDEISVPSGNGLDFSNLSSGTLDVTNGTTLVEAILLSGSYAAGNFEICQEPQRIGVVTVVVYAPDGQPSNVPLVSPDISAPASETVAAQGTLGLGSVSLSEGISSLTITATSGTLFMNGASGSGTNQLTLGGASQSAVNADLATLSYVAGATSGNAQIEITATESPNPAGTPTTSRYIPIQVTGTASSGPTLSEPSSENVAAGGTVAVSGSYSDSFAQGNPGQLFLGISDSGGTLSATDASGNPVSGSGTNSIALNTDYTDLNAILKSLTYAAGAGAGSDAISFEIWNQAGVETTDTVPVMVTSGGNAVSWTGAANDGQWNTAGNWSDNAVPTSGDTVTIAPTSTDVPSLANATLSGETIVLGSDSPVGPSAFFNDVTLGAGTTLESSGSGGSIGDTSTLTVASGAMVEVSGSAGLGISNPNSSPATLVNDGTITDTGSGGISLNLVVENQGVISDSSASGGGITIGDGEAILNNGGTIVDAGGRIQLDGAVQGGTVAFTGSGGSLLLGVLNPFAQGAIVTGFGTGDQMVLGAFNPTSMSFNDGTLTLTGGSFGEDIPFAGTLGFGNFELNSTTTGANGTPATTLLYAPDGGAGGTASGEPDISAPGTASVAQGGTLALNDVSIGSAATLTLEITATSGTLYMNGASGNGTDQVTISADTPAAQVNSDLASLRYVPAAGATSDTIEVSAGAPFSVSGTTDTIRYVPVTITGGNAGPSLNEPSSETVSPNGTVAVGGSYSDSFAQGNPGQLFVSISDSSGTLSATDASGHTVSGSGTNSIAVSTDYVDVNAILAGLHYTAGAASGTDQISFEVWNQAGVETTGSTAITIDPPGGSTMASAMQPGANEMASNFSSGIANTPTMQAGSASSVFGLQQQPPVVGVMPIGH